MFNLEFIRLSWEAVRSQKVRSALTLLGIVIGVFAIIVAVTAVQVIQTSAVNTIKSFGSTTFTIESRSNIQAVEKRSRARQALTYDQMKTLAERAVLPVAISPAMYQSSRAEARYRDRKTDREVLFLGTNEHWADNFHRDIDRGRFLNENDVRLASPVVVIGWQIAETLFPTEQALGKNIILNGHRYQVIGVLAKKGASFGMDQDNDAVVPITRLIALFSAGQRDIDITVQASSIERINATMEEAIGHMRVIRRVQPGEPNNFHIESNESLVDSVSEFTGTVAAATAGIGLITLLAAGVGVMNIMLVSVTERTREIGVRKSVGARRKDILAQFLYEAIFLCQIGGILGILIGAAGGNLVGFFVKAPVVFPWLWASLSVLGVTLIAVVFGVYPAFKAAGLDPIDALRYE